MQRTSKLHPERPSHREDPVALLAAAQMAATTAGHRYPRTEDRLSDLQITWLNAACPMLVSRPVPRSPPQLPRLTSSPRKIIASLARSALRTRILTLLPPPPSLSASGSPGPHPSHRTGLRPATIKIRTSRPQAEEYKATPQVLLRPGTEHVLPYRRRDAHSHPWSAFYTHSFGAEHTPLPSSSPLFLRSHLANPLPHPPPRVLKHHAAPEGNSSRLPLARVTEAPRAVMRSSAESTKLQPLAPNDGAADQLAQVGLLLASTLRIWKPSLTTARLPGCLPLLAAGPACIPFCTSPTTPASASVLGSVRSMLPRGGVCPLSGEGQNQHARGRSPRPPPPPPRGRNAPSVTLGRPMLNMPRHSALVSQGSPPPSFLETYSCLGKGGNA